MRIHLSLQSLSKWVLFVAIVVFIITTNTRTNRLMCVIIVSICGLNMVTRRDHKLHINTMLVGYFLYTLLLCVSSLYAIAPSSKVQSLLISCLTTLALSVCFIDNVNTKDDIHLYLKAFMIGALVQIVSLLSYYGLNTIRIMQQTEASIRIGDDVSNSNSVGMSLAYGTIIAAFFFLTSNGVYKRNLKWIYIVIAIVTGGFSLLSGSRKALVILGFGLAVLFTFCGNSKGILKRMRSILITLAILLILYYLLNNINAFRVINIRMNSLIQGLSGSQAYDHSAATRFRFISEGLKAFSKHPFLGEGVYSSYNYFGTYSHNNFVEILMNTGSIGFLVFYIPYMVVLSKFMKTNKQDKTYWIVLVLFLWIFIGGYGMVTYYNKLNEFMVLLSNQWILINDRENLQDINERDNCKESLKMGKGIVKR